MDNSTQEEENGHKELPAKFGYRFVVRDAKPDDCDHIYELLAEQAEQQGFTRQELQQEVEADDLREDAFGNGHEPRFEAIVAEELNTGKLVGYVIMVNKYALWKRRVLWMEEIFVHRNYRKLHIAEAMMRRMAQRAIHAEYPNYLERIEWAVETFNQPALNLYQKHGAFDLTAAKKWHLYRWKGDSFRKFLKSQFIAEDSIKIEQS